MSSLQMKSEGDKLLNEGLDTIKYKLKKITHLPLYTKIQVKLPVPPKKVIQQSNQMKIIKFTLFSVRKGGWNT